MPTRGVKSPKRARQISKIKSSAKKAGKRAVKLAERTVNKLRGKVVEAKKAPRRSTAGKTSRSKSSTSSRSKK